MNGYREQYDRMMRRYDRFRTISTGQQDAESLRDDALAFFEACLHLRDWIKNDVALSRSIRSAVCEYVIQSAHLKLCHDIAIGSKHLAVTRPKTDQHPRLRTRRSVEQVSAESLYGADDDDEMFLPPGYVVHRVSVRLDLETDADRMVDAFEFATKCVEEWDNFLKQNGI